MPPNLFSPAVRRLLIIVIASLAFIAMPAFAAVEKQKSVIVHKITLRVVQNPDFDRLIFEGPRGMTYEMRREGRNVSVQFTIRGTIDLNRITSVSRVKNFSSRREQKGKNSLLIVNFEISPQAVVKDFTKGSSVIIDILGPAIEVPSDNKAETKPVKESDTKTQDSVGSGTTDKSISSSTDAKVGNDKPLTATSSQEDVSKYNQVASFDPKVVIGAAVFERGGFGTIIFDRKLTISQADLTAGSPLGIELKQLDLPRNSAFRFEIPENTDIRVSRSGSVWRIFFVKSSEKLAITTNFIAQPDFALGARVLLPYKDPPDPVRYTDPVVGDDLIVFPLRDATSFSVPRRMADFNVIPAAQGLVIQPLHEKVTARAFAEGIEISAEGGLKLSPVSDTGVIQKISKSREGGKTSGILFDFAVWKGKPGETFTTRRQKLSRTVVEVSEAERDLARLELARFYFSYGMGEETLALLSVLARKSPEIASHPEFLALRGAANILAGHAQEGLRDLANPELVMQPEIKLWQAVGAALLRDWAGAEEKFNYAEELLANYPEPFHSRFSILSVEAALGADKDREAAEWLGNLEKRPHSEEIEPAIKYLHGVLHSKAGRAEAAGNMWREAAQSGDRLYKTRAELALIDLGVATRSLTPLQAAERLEGLRFAWRGDDLELDILRRLGDFYIEAENFKAGLSVLAQAVRLYPNSVLTPPIRAMMSKTFRDIFLTNLGSKLTPIEAYTIYQSYPELIPAGEEGFILKSNLAERLVEIDLLDQAAALLDDQIKSGLIKGEAKMRAGARLAAIRLLDHKPDEAIKALEVSQENLPPGPTADDINNQRQLLRARAMSEQGKNDEALALLQNNSSQTAKILRADITMRAKRWADAAKALLEAVGPPPKPGGLLTSDQAQWLVKCAIAFSLADDMDGLNRLAINYGAAMAGTPQRDTFGVLTRPESINQMRDIAMAQTKITEVDMFRGFLESYRAPPGRKPEEKKN